MDDDPLAALGRNVKMRRVNDGCIVLALMPGTDIYVDLTPGDCCTLDRAGLLAYHYLATGAIVVHKEDMNVTTRA